MNEQAPDNSDKENEAHRLVGQFLQRFAQLEQAINDGIGKLLGLEGAKNEIICANIPFAKKIDVFFSAEGLLASLPHGDRNKQLKDTRSGILKLNGVRIIFAHNSFSATEDGGISFRRVVAKGVLNISTINLTSREVDNLCDQANRHITNLENLIRDMIPYTPSLDLSDSRNTLLFMLLMDDL